MSSGYRVRCALAAVLHIAPTELDPYRDYRDHIALMAEFLRQALRT